MTTSLLPRYALASQRSVNDADRCHAQDPAASTAAETNVETVNTLMFPSELVETKSDTPQSELNDPSGDWTSQPLYKAAVRMWDDYLVRRNDQMPTPATSPLLSGARHSARTSQQEASRAEQKSSHFSPTDAKPQPLAKPIKLVSRARARSASFDPLSSRERHARAARKDRVSTPRIGARSPKSPKTPKPPTPPQCPGAPKGIRNPGYCARMAGEVNSHRLHRMFKVPQTVVSFRDPVPPINHDSDYERPKLEDYALLMKLVGEERLAIRRDFEKARKREEQS